MKTTTSLLRSLLLVLAALPLLTSMSSAQTNGTWITTAPTGDTGNWSDPSKWTATGVPNGGGNAIFGAYANDRTITVDGTSVVYTINKLTITPRTSGFVGKNFTLNATGGSSLAIGAGGIDIDNGNTAAISVPIEVTANQTWNALSSPSGSASFSGIISGVGKITRTSTGGTGSVFTFSGANTFSGGYEQSATNSPTTRLGVSSVAGSTITSGPLGTGTVTLNGGTLTSNAAAGAGDRTLFNNIVIGGNLILGNSTNTGVLTFSDSGLTAPTTFTLGSANNGNVTVLRSPNTALNFNQVIAESGGTNQSVNFAAATTAAPTVTINRTKTAGGNILIGGTALVLANGAANSGALLGVNGSIAATGSNKFSSGALISDATSLIATDATNFSAIAGSKATVYRNARVSFATDQTQATVAGLFSSDSQVRLGLGSGSGSATVTENYNQSAIGNGYAGLVSASTGTITYNGTLTAGSDSTFRVGGGLGTLALGNALTGSGKALSVEGGGTVTSTSNNTYDGATTINGTTTTLSGSSGALSGTSGVTINNSGTLNLTNNTGSVNTNRIGTVDITLNSGLLALNGTSTTAASETLGDLYVNSGGRNFVTVATTPAAATVKTLQFGTLNRANNALAIFRGDTLGTTATARNEIKFSSAPSLTGGGGAAGTTTISILPWARGATAAANSPSTFVTYEANGVRALAAATEFVQANNDTTSRIDQAIASAGGATNYNVRSIPGTTGSATLVNTASSSITLNSLLFDNTGATATATYSLNSSTINVTSGAIHIQQTANQGITLGTGTLAFGSVEGVITTNGANNTNIATQITGSGGLSLYLTNGGSLQLSQVTTSGYSGGLTFGGNGIVGVDQDQRFGNSANAITHAGGSLQFFAAFTSTRGLTLLGNVGNNTLANNTTSGTMIWNGNITGAGLLRLINNASTAGTGGFTLGGSNDYAGGTQIEGIAVTGSTNNAFGTGTVTLIGGTGNAPSLTLTGTAPTLGGLRGTDGTVTVNPTASTATLTIGAINDNTVFNGVIAQGAGKTASVTKTGTGTLVLGGSNTYTGATTVSTGTLLINGSTSASSAVTVNAGGTIGGSGIIGGSLTLAGGDLKPGNSPGLLTVGSLTLNSGTTTMEINSTGRGTTYDALNIASGGAVQFGGALVFNFGNAADFADNTSFSLFSFNTTSTGDFSGITSTGWAAYAGLTWSQSGDVWSATAGNGQTLNFSELDGSLNVVPEPATWALLAFSMTTVMILRRRRSPSACK